MGRLSNIDLSMKRMRDVALGAIVLLNVVATTVAFGESYAGLYRWAFEHGVQGFWAAVWPMMVDLVILVAEAGLFVAHYDKWETKHKAWLWFVMLTALSVSTGGNTGHVHSTDWLSRLTAALPPVALMFTTTVGFGVMKRTFLHKQPAESETSQEAPLSPPAGPLSEMLTETSQPVLKAESETPGPVTQPTEMHHIEGNVWGPAEKPAPDVPPADPDLLSETLIKFGFKVTEKSYTMPKDPREGLSLRQARVRDMYDVDPDISVNAIASALGIAWATADKHLKETKEARGV